MNSYVVAVSGWGGYLPDANEDLRPWRSKHAVIVQAESVREALDQVMGKTSRYPLLGSEWKVYELGPHVETWKTRADSVLSPITAYRVAALDEQLGDLGSPPTSERSTAP